MVTRQIARLAEDRIFFGWFVLAASLLVSFGVIGASSPSAHS